MISRKFQPPQDWSALDQVRFRLHMKTDAAVPHGRVLGVGFAHGGAGVQGAAAAPG